MTEISCQKLCKSEVNKSCQQDFYAPAKVSFNNESEINTFSDNQHLRKFITNRAAL